MDKVNKETQGFSVHGVRFSTCNLTFADDIGMIEEDDEEMLERIVNELNEDRKRYG